MAGIAPGWQMLVLLVVTIGAPFVLLASTSPLLQAWLAQHRGARDPYRLFVLSNLASLAALTAYPWAIEPWLGTGTQALVWSALYVVYVALALDGLHQRPACAYAGERRRARRGRSATRVVRLGAQRLLGWIALAALASYELVAVTNHLTQNIPSIPMTWVLPLGTTC